MDWPGLQKIDTPPVVAGDCVLVCAGFEDRSIGALARIYQSGVTGVSVGIIDYLPLYSENRKEEVLGLAQKAGFSVEEFIYDRENPAGIGEKLFQFVGNFNRVFIDISGMSRLLIVQVLVALLVPGGRPITIIYSEANEYPPCLEEFERDKDNDNTNSLVSYLSSGVFEIVATPELSSVSMLGAAIRLIAFLSFDPSQFKNLLHELQPAYIDTIEGMPPSKKNQWRMHAIRHLNQSNLNLLQVHKNHNASTLHYKETLKLLLKIYSERSMFDRIVIAPTGSKMQAVAVGLFRAVLYDTQIVYPTPQVFTTPTQHTIGIRQIYKIDLPSNIVENHETNGRDMLV